VSGPTDTLKEVPRGIKYICGQIEICPNPAPGKNPHHVQGYLETEARLSAGHIRNMCRWRAEDGVDVKFLPRNGTQEQAIKYTQKPETAVEGTWREFGTKAPPDAPGSLKEVERLIQEGGTMKEICRSHFATAVRYFNGLQKILTVLEESEDFRVVSCCVLWGDPGVGKTSNVYRAFGPHNVYRKLDHAMWWDGYDGQEVVLFDDFRCQYPLRSLLEWCDGYPVQVNCRGYTRWAAWKYIIFTTNMDPATWYPAEPHMNVQALQRRIPRRNWLKVEQGMPASTVCDFINPPDKPDPQETGREPSPPIVVPEDPVIDSLLAM
jgi:hypothetical protein